MVPPMMSIAESLFYQLKITDTEADIYGNAENKRVSGIWVRSSKGFSVDLGLPWSLIFDVLFSYFFLFPVLFRRLKQQRELSVSQWRQKALEETQHPNGGWTSGHCLGSRCPWSTGWPPLSRRELPWGGAAFPRVGTPGGFCRQTRWGGPEDQGCRTPPIHCSPRGPVWSPLHVLERSCHLHLSPFQTKQPSWIFSQLPSSWNIKHS